MKKLLLLQVLSLAALLVFGCQDQLVEPEAAEDTGSSVSTAAKRLPGSDHGGRPLTATLTGAAEVPVPGDPDGSGSASVTLNQGQGTVCFELTAQDIAPARAAHIHVGAAGTPGPVVVGLVPPTSGTSSGCVEDVASDLIKAIRQNPEDYYVNVHNVDFPGGALRGQLGK